jgi:hypothetical protein
MTQGQLDLRTLDRLLSWLAVYVFCWPPPAGWPAC